MTVNNSNKEGDFLFVLRGNQYLAEDTQIPCERNDAVDKLFNGKLAEEAYQNAKTQVWQTNCQNQKWYKNLSGIFKYALGFLTLNHYGLLAKAKKNYKELNGRVKDLTQALKEAVKTGSKVSIKKPTPTTLEQGNANIATETIFTNAIDEVNRAIFELSQNALVEEQGISLKEIVDTTIADYIAKDCQANPLLNKRSSELQKIHSDIGASWILTGAFEKQLAAFLETPAAEMTSELRDKTAETIAALLRQPDQVDLKTMLSQKWIIKHQEASEKLLKALRENAEKSLAALTEVERDIEKINCTISKLEGTSSGEIAILIGKQKELQKQKETLFRESFNALQKTTLKAVSDITTTAQELLKPIASEDTTIDQSALQQRHEDTKRTLVDLFQQNLTKAESQVLSTEYQQAERNLAIITQDLQKAKEFLEQQKTDLVALEARRQDLAVTAQRDQDELATKSELFQLMERLSERNSPSEESYRSNSISPAFSYERSYERGRREQYRERGYGPQPLLNKPYFSSLRQEEVVSDSRRVPSPSRDSSQPFFLSPRSSPATVVPARSESISSMD